MITTIRFSILVIDVEIVQSVQLTAYNLEMFGIFSQKKLLSTEHPHGYKVTVLNSGSYVCLKSPFFLNFLLID